jgi:hypothetical protein
MLDSNKAVLSEVRQNQASACQAMVARHAKNHNLPTSEDGDVVGLLLPERFWKLSRKPFIICQVKSGPHRGSFQLFCVFDVLNRRYPASKLQPVPSTIWSGYSFPVSSCKVSISEVAEQLRQAPKLHKCICKTYCGPRCSCVRCNIPCSPECHKGTHIPCGNHFAAAAALNPQKDAASQPDQGSVAR